MSQNKNSNECRLVCWGIAAVAGIVAMIMLYMLAEFGFLQSFFVGGLLGVVLGIVLIVFMCRSQTAAADLAADEKPAGRYAREAAEDKAARTGEAVSAPAPAAASADAAKPVAAASAAPAVVSASKPLPGQAELASRKGEWKYETDAAKETQAEAIPAVALSSAPVAEEKPKAAKKATKTADKKATKAKEKPAKAAKKAPAKAAAKAPAKPKRAPVAADGQPELLSAPQGGVADDLKLISGVGPKLEQTLNELGFWHFNQVAGWRKKEIEWVDSRLRFKGRIERDDWMSQAKILAKGGETEFSKRKKK